MIGFSFWWPPPLSGRWGGMPSNRRLRLLMLYGPAKKIHNAQRVFSESQHCDFTTHPTSQKQRRNITDIHLVWTWYCPIISGNQFRSFCILIEFIFPRGKSRLFSIRRPWPKLIARGRVNDLFRLLGSVLPPHPVPPPAPRSQCSVWRDGCNGVGPVGDTGSLEGRPVRRGGRRLRHQRPRPGRPPHTSPLVRRRPSFPSPTFWIPRNLLTSTDSPQQVSKNITPCVRLCLCSQIILKPLNQLIHINRHPHMPTLSQQNPSSLQTNHSPPPTIDECPWARCWTLSRGSVRWSRTEPRKLVASGLRGSNNGSQAHGKHGWFNLA